MKTRLIFEMLAIFYLWINQIAELVEIASVMERYSTALQVRDDDLRAATFLYYLAEGVVFQLGVCDSEGTIHILRMLHVVLRLVFISE